MSLSDNISKEKEVVNLGFEEEFVDSERVCSHGSVKEKTVKRGLKPRHISMIALGGTIGTGLFISISAPLANAGPVGALIAYMFMGTLAYMVTQALGEMATFIPVTSSFMVFTQRFMSPALGAANGYMYWLSWSITFALELSVVGQVIQFWTDAVPLAAWIAIFWVILTCANLIPVKFYGEIEFWIACIKVIAIVGFIIYCLCMVCGAGVTGPVGFRYWRNPGPWGPGIISSNVNEGRFLGWVSSLISAAFTYQGTELVGITAGEAANPRKSVPKAINKVFFRILFFYILSLFFIGLLVPYNDPKLTSSDSYISSSPFVIAIENSGTKVLPHIFNAVILTTIISAGNSDVYVSSRVLFSMANNGLAPKFLKRATASGIPYAAVLVTSLMGFLAYLDISNGASVVFTWLLNITAVAGFFAWLLISMAHIRFMAALKYRGISRDDLPFKAKLMPWGSYYASFFIAVIIIIQGFTAFCPFNVSNFFAAYISVILFFVIWIGFQIFFRGPILVDIKDIDLDTDRTEIDNIIWEEEEPKNLWEKFWVAIA
ncbi:LAFE_0G02278g1_1 [Lachancea fermentati]|uniref:LAFE_0G02278g1_1 n=1 Tax=Lachancea fermentati TaxID=4955 RepID=A0A1G4MGR2_LACFM|nr:LAFE_0G02278g1_1 [Lachancea fermentati]